MRRILLGLCLTVLLIPAAYAALTFPPLTGRVVDNAHVLSAETQARLTQELAAFETQTTNQIVVVTLPSLQGISIEDYGYQLGRAWGIGQKGKNNGAILIVAPTEHKVRIEVGYGLEETLTDAKSAGIVQGIILPAFRAHQMEGGIIDGTYAILSTLGGTAIDSAYRATPSAQNLRQQQNDPMGGIILFIIIMIFVFGRAYLGRNMLMLGGMSAGGWGSGGGGFSGGGGSFGGGGASGSW